MSKKVRTQHLARLRKAYELLAADALDRLDDPDPLLGLVVEDIVSARKAVYRAVRALEDYQPR